jgi:hypothetical protein
MEERELWSFQNALLFVILLIVILWGIISGSKFALVLKKIKEDWPNHRCTPLIMPFASWFGVNAKENFDFCMGKVFTNQSQSFFGSIGMITTKFNALLQMIFGSLNSLRNTMASLGGGINVIFQEFTERISMFFFKLRMSSIYLKSLFMRMYALLFSVMYMGISGITGMSSFTNTFLFSFLDTFCFPEDTPVSVIRDEVVLRIPIRDVRMDDVLYPSKDRVTGLFRFYSRGQPMVRLGSITVSTNHYLYYNGKRIRAGQHPDAIPLGGWDSDRPLYCLNTNTHHIPMNGYLFMDYDETPEGDEETMNYVEKQLNAGKSDTIPCHLTEYGSAIGSSTKIHTKNGLCLASDIQIGDVLSTGSTVVGVIRKKVTEYDMLGDGTEIALSTLYWDEEEQRWRRWIQSIKDDPKKRDKKPEKELCSFVVVPNSQLELENGMRIRDYMEWCSPDAEHIYSQKLEKFSS